MIKKFIIITLLILLFGIGSRLISSKKSNSFPIIKTSATSFVGDNIQNNFSVNFNHESSPQIKLSSKDNEIILQPETTNQTAFSPSDNHTLLLTDAYQNTDLTYQITPRGVKEEIILKEKPTSLSEFNFILSAKDKKFKPQSDGSIIAFSLNDKPIFIIPPGFMKDANNKISKDIKYELTLLDNQQYQLQVIPNYEWLVDPSRTYPVIIDPSIELIDSPSTPSITEDVSKRTSTSKTFSLGNNRYQHQQILKTVMHYSTNNPDSKNYDANVDFTPERVNNSQLDGWLINQADWHYALGKPKTGPLADQDGTVGFGGQQGQNWFKFRLERAGYLNYDTKNWQDIGGTASYDRVHLSSQTQELTIGPEGAQETISVSNSAVWHNLWTTPGGGEVSISWRTDGRQLKEEVILNQQAREWITTNRPPNSGYEWFGWLFKLDVSDIPRFTKNNLVLGQDFDDSDGTIGLKDNLDRLLAFMPIDSAWSGTDPSQTITLRKRIWKDESNNWWLVVGARTNELNSLPAGDIIFDPTLELQPDATDGVDNLIMSYSDGVSSVATTVYSTSTGGAITSHGVEYAQHLLVKFDFSSLPEGATITSATVYLYRSNTTINWNNDTAKWYRILSVNSSWTEAQASWRYAVKNISTPWAGDTDDNGGLVDSGCGVAGTDYDATPMCSVSVPSQNPGILGTEYSASLNLTEFGEMVSANYGGVWIGDPGHTYTNFGLSDNATAGYRPKLVVEYSSAAVENSTQFEGIKMEGVCVGSAPCPTKI